MAVRRRVAERISTVKARAGLQTPVLNEIPLIARITSSAELAFPRVRGVIPVIAKGKATGEVAGRWYRVPFPKPISEPSVVCVGEARRGEIPTITLPTIRVGAVPKIPPLEKVVAVPEIPKLSAIPKIPELAELTKLTELTAILKEALPSLQLPSVPTSLGRFVVTCPTIFGIEACPPGADLLKKLAKQLNTAMELIEKGLVRINEIISKIDARLETIRTTLNDKLAEVDDRLDTLRTNVNTRFGDIDGRLSTVRSNIDTRLGDIDDRLSTLRLNVNDRLSKVGAGVDERLETLRTSMNSRVEELRSNTENATNDALKTIFPRLYEAWGIARNYAITSLHIRNVTSTGFEFQSYGNTTAYWIAVGHRVRE